MATDPLNQTERIEYRDHAPGIAASDVAAPAGMAASNAELDLANTFYWDKKAYAEFPGDYTKARLTHWLLAADNTLSSLASSTKEPLEGRVFLTYQPGPANPLAGLAHLDTLSSTTAIGRVLDDATTRLSAFSYNLIGKPTQVIDPMGRETDFVYAANNVDLLQVNQKNGSSSDMLFKATYNAQHLPLTTTDAAGQATSYTYNFAGQPLTITNPKSETSTMAYDVNGYLQTVTGAIAGSTTTFTYDSVGRVQTVTDSEGYTITNAYDSLDRLTKQTFPDSTVRQTVYDRLNVGSEADRLNRTTTYTNNAIGQVVSIKDALNQVTNLTWCKCGALQTLQDPKGNTTSWTRDVQGRATAKTYADGKGDTFVHETSTSRLKSKTDALGQVISYGYAKDDNVTAITYTNAKNPTPNVSFAYDPVYNRRTSMVDGTGTTTYAYNPVNGLIGAERLQSVAGLWRIRRSFTPTISLEESLAVRSMAQRTKRAQPMTLLGASPPKPIRSARSQRPT